MEGTGWGEKRGRWVTHLLWSLSAVDRTRAWASGAALGVGKRENQMGGRLVIFLVFFCNINGSGGCCGLLQVSTHTAGSSYLPKQIPGHSSSTPYEDQRAGSFMQLGFSFQEGTGRFTHTKKQNPTIPLKLNTGTAGTGIRNESIIIQENFSNLLLQ